MCDAMLEQKIRAKVWSMVRGTETFTAFDVTTALRAENPNMSILHYEVRTVVHDMFENDEFFDGGDYQRTLVKLKCGPNALVFHPDGFDPLDHPEADVPMSSALPCGPTVIDDGTNGQDRDGYTDDQDRDNYAVADYDDEDDVVDDSTDDTPEDALKTLYYNADSRGRLCIRRNDLKSIGIGKNCVVFVSTEMREQIIIAGPNYKKWKTWRYLHTDRNGNLRLAPGYLTEVGFDSGAYEPHTIKVYNDHLIVRK